MATTTGTVTVTTTMTSRSVEMRERERGVPRSLVISPDLDALLAYDEQTRQRGGPVSPVSPVGGGGLPPPPRGPRRRPRTGLSPLGGGTGVWVGGWNPYINPAPGAEPGEEPGGYKRGTGVEVGGGMAMESRTRPMLVSHEGWGRGSGSGSSRWSGSSEGTLGPASTVEARISISSTAYAPSSVQSHPQSMYSDQPLPFIQSPHRTSSLDRESFMDMHTGSDEFASFDLPPLTLPSTQQRLDVDERTKLIRRNRKLVRVLGQNPGPLAPGLHRTALSLDTRTDRRGHSAPASPPSPTSFIDLSIDSPMSDDDDRRRKRDKLAKLHRFLGSRVPPNLVLGLPDPELSLPLPLAAIPAPPDAPRPWLRRRRSSSAAAFSATWSDHLDRVKDNLDDKEKALNVRRALKMEKVFGVAPPQTLYHTRRSPSPAPNASPAPSPSRYSKPRLPKRADRPSTSDSTKALLPKPPADAPASRVYTHYQHSLNSLSDIIDRDDRASLAELHQYLSAPDAALAPPPPPLVDFARAQPQPPQPPRRSSASSGSVKSERRRSLPARTSVLSLASQFSIDAPPPHKPDATDFQARRRRAAKLAQFFGVDYRELITDVLDSIELGLEHERKRGTLNPQEAEDLFTRLGNLKSKKPGFF